MTPTTQRRKKGSPGLRQKSPVEVLVSGGIDSAALLAFYLRERFDVRPLFVDFGQPAVKQALRAARAVCKHYSVRLSIMGSSTVNRGQEHHCATSALAALEGRPLRLGGGQGGMGVWKQNSSSTVQR